MGPKRGSDEPVADYFFEEESGTSFHHKITSLERVASRYFGYLTLVKALALLLYAAAQVF